MTVKIPFLTANAFCYFKSLCMRKVIKDFKKFI